MPAARTRIPPHTTIAAERDVHRLAQITTASPRARHGKGWVHRLAALGLTAATALLFTAVAVLAGAGPAAAADPCNPVVNPIACENSKPGTPSGTWEVSSTGRDTIQGFATQISVNAGETQRFKVKTTAASYRLDIYRMGYYAGNGARLIASVNPVGRQTQPACLSNASTGLIDCGNWAVSASWAVPGTAVSGIYFARLVRTDGVAGANHVFFVVRNDASHSALLFQTSDTTWQAYNRYGGNSLYTGSPAGRAYKVSYNRPFTTRDTSSEDFVFNAEYPMVRFLESNGYDVSYLAGADVDRRGSLLLNHKVYLSVGHDEYVSGAQRANIEAARAAGVSLAYFSGNQTFWKTRWENSIDGSGTAYRTLVCYKETHADGVIDPLDPPTWTGTWRDPRFSPPADGGRPENALSGTIFKVNSGTVSLQVPSADGRMRLWRNTSVASLPAGSTATLGAGTIGYEWDEDADNGARPKGLVRASTTVANGVQVLQDYGSNYGTGTATHHVTLYRAPSGALVFGAGTVQWSWGLDSNHDRGSGATSTPMRQATVNLFADMGAQPATLQPGLVPATASTDTTAPTTTITAPADGSTVQVATAVTLSGTATDSGGGVVGAVEVSTDDGGTWHPAAGRSTWSYTWIPQVTGAVTVKVRASDDSLNLGSPTAVAVTVTTRTCPCSIWTSAVTPTTTAEADTRSVELGVKFRSDTAGQVTGVRFYKGAGNAGTHVGRLWSATGTLLATVTFTGESSTGWQQATFATPVAITANTTYVISYYAPAGHYAVDPSYFAAAGTDAAPLHALKDGQDGGNGVYRYGTGGVFPTNTWASANYWVDVVLTVPPDPTRPTVIARTPAPGATDVGTGTTVTATFSDAVQPGTIAMSLSDPTGTGLPGTIAYDGTTRTATFTPSSPLASATTYTATVNGARDLSGNVMTTVSWSFTTIAPDTAPPAVANRTPGDGATGVPVSSAVTATFSEPVQPGTIAMAVKNAAGTEVAGSVGYDNGTRRATFTPTSALAYGGTYTVTVSGATDLSGNAMIPVSWSFTTATDNCPCTIWANSATPAIAAEPDTRSVELGARFRSDTAGQVTGVRFYKGTGNTGTHVGRLWSATGTLLATVTFTGESSTGWQQATFATPVAITANTTYVISYYAPAGHYAVNNGGFATAGVDRPPLHALKDGQDGPNGVYRYGTGGVFPTNTYSSANYWVDVVFATPAPDTAPPAVANRTPGDGATGVPVSSAVTATFSEPVQPGTIAMAVKNAAGTEVAGSVGYDNGTRRATFTPTSALAYGGTYTVTVSGATDLSGNAMIPVSWSFTTATDNCPCTIWANSATPAIAAEPDTRSVELGARFRSDTAGQVTGVRFYKGTGNTGTHVGRLWSATGTLLATVTFTGESSTGWQQATFATPVAITANTTYVISYYAPAGHYAVNNGGFATAGVDRPPLHALKDGQDGPNGVYRYGTGGVFPTNTYSSANYWVDVVFATA